jgi:hypothetical protein
VLQMHSLVGARPISGANALSCLSLLLAALGHCHCAGSLGLFTAYDLNRSLAPPATGNQRQRSQLSALSSASSSLETQNLTTSH